jgi:signal transduction histidine kinase
MSLQRSTLQSALDKSIASAIDRITLKQIDLTVSYPEKEAFVLLDEEKIQLAFLNIIINAVEAMEEGKGKIAVSIEEQDDEYIVEIEDNGCGISEENMQRLFEPYFTSKRNGMGLGLASTLNIIQSHNGHVDVKSEEGKGTSFIIGFKKAN